MIKNINPYNKTEFEKIFKNTKIYKKLEQDFGESNLLWEQDSESLSCSNDSHGPWLSLDINGNDPNKISHINTSSTPRQDFSNFFSATIFYYLMPLLEKDYNAIYDIGCGANLFKSYLPRLIGVGAEEIIADMKLVNWYNNVKDSTWPMILNKKDFENLPVWIKQECILQHGISAPSVNFYGDIHGFVDDVYIQEHQNYFQSVFSICALHFHPLHLFKKVVLDFVSMIAIGGRGFLALNLQRMIQRESNQFLLQEFLTITPSRSQYDQYIRKELSTLNLNFLILDVNLACIRDSMNGNVRLVVER